MERGLSTVPDDRTCTDVLQQWNVPRNYVAEKPSLFTDLQFEKADCENDSERKRPILSASRGDYCATPPTARAFSPERLKKLKADLCGSSTLFESIICDTNFTPCTLFPTSFTTQKSNQDSLISVDPRREIFDDLLQEIDWNHADNSYQKFVTDFLSVSKYDVKKIEKETMDNR